MYWIETKIPMLLFYNKGVGTTLIKCIWLLFEEFDYTHTKNDTRYVELLGYTTELNDENDLNNPLDIYISIDSNNKFDVLLYKDKDRWDVHKKLTKLLKNKLYNTI